MKMSFEKRMEEEYIPPAPAFCERITPEEAEIQAQKQTNIGLENLYNDVVNKIDADRKKKEDEKEIAYYGKLMKQSKLLEKINAFFECDENRQKAKFMNMLIDNNRNAEKMINMESKLRDLEEIVNEMKDNEEHMNEIMEGYEEGEKEFKAVIMKQKSELESKEIKICKYRELINRERKSINNKKIFYRFIIFLQTLLISYILLVFNIPVISSE